MEFEAPVGDDDAVGSEEREPPPTSVTHPNLVGSSTRKRPRGFAVKTLDEHSFSFISLFSSCLPVCDVYPHSRIGIFNDPVPWSLLLWLSLYFSGFVCIAGPSQCN